MTFASVMSERTVLSIATESTIFILINITAILGNCFVLAAISRKPRLRKTANWYILTLAISDLFVAVTCMPLTMGASLKGEWVYSHVICQTQGYVIRIWVIFSLIIIAATAVHRYFGVVRQVRLREIFTKTLITLMVISCLILSTATAVGLPFALNVSFQFVHSNTSQQKNRKGGCVVILCGCCSNPVFNIALLLFQSLSRRPQTPDSCQAKSQTTTATAFGLFNSSGRDKDD